MREINCADIINAVERLCIKAAVWLPPDLAILLECAEETEESPAGISAMHDIVENYKFAGEKGLPICQDTGMAVVFVELGQDVHITGGSFNDAVNEGVRRGYVNGCLRKSVVSDPLRRVNTNDNTPAVIHTTIVDGDRIKITVAPKGFGSENMSAMKMFLPSSRQSDIEDFIVSVVANAGSNPCPPIVLGVGLGGTVEKAALLAKQALARDVDTRNPDPYYASMERRVLTKINRLGIGPQGFGGVNTAIAVNDQGVLCEFTGADLPPAGPMMFGLPRYEPLAKSGTQLFEADTVVYAVGQAPLRDEALALRECAPEFYMIGDCVAPKNIYNASSSGYFTARGIGKRY